MVEQLSNFRLKFEEIQRDNIFNMKHSILSADISKEVLIEPTIDDQDLHQQSLLDLQILSQRASRKNMSFQGGQAQTPKKTDRVKAKKPFDNNSSVIMLEANNNSIQVSKDKKPRDQKRKKSRRMAQRHTQMAPAAPGLAN